MDEQLIKDVNKNVERSDGTDGRQRGSLLPGTRLIGGGGVARRKSFIAKLRAYNEELRKRGGLSFNDPAEMLSYILMTGKDPLAPLMNAELGEQSPYAEANMTESGADGVIRHVNRFVDLETRIDVARILLPFVRPKLNHATSDAEDNEGTWVDEARKAQMMGEDPDVRRLMEKIVQKNSEKS